MKKPVILILAAALISGCVAEQSAPLLEHESERVGTEGCWDEQPFNLVEDQNLIHYIQAADYVEVQISTIRNSWEVELSHDDARERHLVPGDTQQVISASAGDCSGTIPTWGVTITQAAFENGPRAMGRIRWRKPCAWGN